MNFMVKVSAIVAFFIFGSESICAITATKQQKLEQLFELTNDRKVFSKMYEPLFAGVNITDEKVKEAAMDKFFVSLKKDFIAAYDKHFTEEDITNMVCYHNSATAKKAMTKAIDLGAELQKAYGGMMSIIQEIVTAPEKSAGIKKSTVVIDFSQAAQGKTDNEIKEIFNKEIAHEGLTIVKFSSLRCGPCRAYAPIFDRVAEQLHEVLVDGKKIAVKYIAVDIDVVNVIAQEYKVKSIPTTIFFKNDKQLDVKIGSIQEDALKTRIQELAK